MTVTVRRPGPGDPVRLSSQEAIGLRLARQHLDRRAPAHDWLGVVRDIGGVQVQSMSAARMALWARVEKLPYAAIDDALSRTRTLVKTWAMRETVHLLTSDDFVHGFCATTSAC